LKWYELENHHHCSGLTQLLSAAFPVSTAAQFCRYAAQFAIGANLEKLPV
jgi:hypothetical protein